jgi:hypothetical protein
VKLDNVLVIITNTWESTIPKKSPKPAESTKKIIAIKCNNGHPSFKSQLNTADSSSNWKGNVKLNDKVNAKKDGKLQHTAHGKGKGKGKGKEGAQAHQANEEFASLAVEENIPMVCPSVPSHLIAHTEADLQTDVTHSGVVDHAAQSLETHQELASELAQALRLDLKLVKLPPLLLSSCQRCRTSTISFGAIQGQTAGQSS